MVRTEQVCRTNVCETDSRSVGVSMSRGVPPDEYTTLSLDEDDGDAGEETRYGGSPRRRSVILKPLPMEEMERLKHVMSSFPPDADAAYVASKGGEGGPARSTVEGAIFTGREHW